MPQDLEALATAGAEAGAKFQAEGRAIDRAWRSESLADLVQQLKVKAIEDGDRLDNADA